MKKVIILVLLILLLCSIVNAQVSVKLEKTNPGIVGEKAAILEYEIKNDDKEHKVQSYLLCMSPDDVYVKSSFGGEPVGVQYVSSLFTMDKDYQGSMDLKVMSPTSPGDKNPGCIFKYMPYKEENGWKNYLRMNGDYTTELKDSDYRQLLLSQTAPFVTGMTNPQCPTGMTHCTSSQVIDESVTKQEQGIIESPKAESREEVSGTTGKGFTIPTWVIVLFAFIVLLALAFFFGMRMRKESVQQAEGEVQKQATKTFCKKCGLGIPADSDFCQTCGAKQ